TRVLDDVVPSMDVGIAWRRGADQSPAVRAFRDFLGLSFNGGGPGMLNWADENELASRLQAITPLRIGPSFSSGRERRLKHRESGGSTISVYGRNSSPR